MHSLFEGFDEEPSSPVYCSGSAHSEVKSTLLGDVVSKLRQLSVEEHEFYPGGQNGVMIPRVSLGIGVVLVGDMAPGGQFIASHTDNGVSETYDIVLDGSAPHLRGVTVAFPDEASVYVPAIGFAQVLDPRLQNVLLDQFMGSLDDAGTLQPAFETTQSSTGFPQPALGPTTS